MSYDLRMFQRTLQGHAPACSIVNVWPAIVIVPVRGAPVAFAWTVNSTVSLPDPLAPFVTVTQAALVAAVHAQPAPAVTVTVPDPPATVTA